MLCGYEEFLKTKRIVLGSKSEPRRILMTQSGLNPICVDSGFAEDLPKENFSTPLEYVKHTALGKLECLLKQPDLKFDMLICSDSVVVDHAGTIIEKPASNEDHINMMKALSNNTHTVLTYAYIVFRKGGKDTRGEIYSDTKIVFGEIPVESCNTMATLYPSLLNAAGGYQVQTFSASLVKEMHGSLTGCIGLPMYELCEKIVHGIREDLF